MNAEVLNVLTQEACASIRYRTEKEILESNPDIGEYLGEIIADKRARYVATWQKEDGYLGDSFHGGWIPDMKLKYYNTGAEAALRFMAEMGIPEYYPLVERCLGALLKDNWKNDRWAWSTVFQPELGLFGVDHIRAVVFAYFGIEEHDFIKTEIQRAFEYVTRVLEISSIEDITGTYQNRLYYNSSIPLPNSLLKLSDT